ncbi:MAG TPA: hypothetical protein PK073_02090 [Ignavibacteriaceae bacterium]|jgi:hypothetical protein|nr:MAG: hypothetical protein BWY38_01817 [Ignavibacteria bacterium ADurb.Bin266]OQY73675.1 MAG: hypothetical protein B6D44_06610 [Ignavibacteriales bacterium UTCHB2]HQF41674.1 hypothetical protein [Ignavibacteriaceae bacterium]HQI40554.1 hypothetical protein [Ignavibacteriaceae bacterium]HQJ45055.1 hypothetical protein [Ignavibacteriaceae bacterium]
MKYKNLRLSFLIEIFVGFITIISIALLGPKGIAVLSLIGLRPVFMQREEIKDPGFYYQNIYKVLNNSLSIISIMLILIIIIFLFIPAYQSKLPPVENLFVLFLPFFLLTHGVIGLINLSDIEKKDNQRS